MFKKLGWMSVYQRCILNRCVLMYKIVNYTAPIYLVNRFSNGREDENYNLRSVSGRSCILNFPHSDFYKRSFSYAGAFLWNNLPETVKESIKSLDVFKRKCKVFISQQFSLNEYMYINMSLTY